MEIVGLEALQRVMDHGGAYEAVQRAMEAVAVDTIIRPEEMAVTLDPAGDVHVKGAHIVDSGWIVFKVATGSFPGAPNSGCSILLDAATGAPTFIFDDGGWLTEMRTAAAGSLAADLLVPQGPLRVAMLGTGIQARYQLAALRQRRTIDELRIWGRTPERADVLATEVGGQVMAEIGEAVSGANLVITATTATEPFLLLDHLDSGVHITAMGADTVGKSELDPAILDRADAIVADDIETCSRVGELQHRPNLAGRAISLARLSAGLEPGRTSPDDITVADLCGIGAYDAAIAGLAAKRLALSR